MGARGRPCRRARPWRRSASASAARHSQARLDSPTAARDAPRSREQRSTPSGPTRPWSAPSSSSTSSDSVADSTVPCGIGGAADEEGRRRAPLERRETLGRPGAASSQTPGATARRRARARARRQRLRGSRAARRRPRDRERSLEPRARPTPSRRCDAVEELVPDLDRRPSRGSTSALDRDASDRRHAGRASHPGSAIAARAHGRLDR